MRRRPSLASIVASSLLSLALASSSASAQSPITANQLPHAARDLLAAGPLYDLPRVGSSPVDASRRRAAARLLDALRTRARALHPAFGEPATMLRRWSAMEREVSALRALARRVAEAGDPALTVEALALVGDAYEAAASYGDRIPNPPSDPVSCGMADALFREQVEDIRAELDMASPTERRALAARLQRLVRDAQQRAAADAASRRWARALSSDDLRGLGDEAPAARQVAIVFFAAAFHLSRVSQTGGPATWHALERLQAEENLARVDEALDHQTLVTDHRSWIAMHPPGATLLEGSPLGPVSLAP